MAIQTTPPRAPAPAVTTAPEHPIGDLLHRIVGDLKTIAKDEVELAKMEIAKTAKDASADAAVILLGGIVALVGLAFVGAAIVAALGYVITPLWIRCLIVAGLYFGGGILVTGVFAKKLKRDAKPNLDEPVAEAKETAEDIKQGLAH